jgi:hypothetical protein
MSERVESTKRVITSTEARAAISSRGRVLQVLALSTALAVAGMIGIYYVFFA